MNELNVQHYPERDITNVVVVFCPQTQKMATNWLGLLSIVVFYIIILAIGIWASRKSKLEEKKCTGNRSEVAMVGGRNLNIWVSICTTTGKKNHDDNNNI